MMYRRLLLVSLGAVLVTCGRPVTEGAEVGEFVDFRSSALVWYPLGPHAADRARGGARGTMHGSTPAMDRNGAPQGCLRFDGTDDYVEVPHSPGALQLGTHDFTLCAWVFTTDSACDDDAPAVIVAKGNPPGSGFALSLECGKPCAFVGEVSENGCATVGGEISDGRWHHVGMVRGGGNVFLYADGQMVHRYNSTESVNTDQPLTLAKHPLEERGFFDGRIDDLIILDRALSAAEMHSLASGE